MGISDFINRLKSEHRAKARAYTANREDQVKLLKAERVELEKKRKADRAYKEEKAKIQELKTEPVRRNLSGLKNLGKNVKKNLDSVEKRKEGNAFGGAFGGSPFGQSMASNPWTGSEPKKKAKKDNITITIRR